MRNKVIIFLGVLLFLIIALVPTAIIFNYIKNKDNTKNTLITTPAKTELPSTAKIEITSEKVFIKNQNDIDFKEAKEGDEISAGTRIMTDKNGRGVVLFPNGSTTRVDKNSEITIREFEKSPFKLSINVELGRIWNRVAKLLGGESYETTSDSAVATVRGTSYGFGILSTGENKITVTKGTVGTICLNKRQASELKGDQKGVFDCKSKVPKLALLDIQDKDEWFDYNKKEDSLLNEMFGTEIYNDTSGSASPESSPTPSATSGPVYILDPIKLSPTLIKLYTPTPTPTPSNFNLKLDTNTLKSLITPTPTPTSTPILRINITPLPINRVF